MATPIPDNDARFTLEEILAATGGRLVSGVASGVASVTSDSRAVRPGGLFVALRGEVHDGHAFVPAAAKAGAAVAIVERGAAVPSSDAIALVEAHDTLAAWGALAKAHLARWKAEGSQRRVVAITGSAGKTTTKELTGALLSEVGPTHFTAGNLNNRIGVPSVVFALRDERFLVLEMGMSLTGELDAICAFAQPDVGVIVNVGLAHSEGVGGREGVMREKGAVYRALGPSGVAVVNADDELVRRAATEAKVEREVTFGRADGAGVRLVARMPSPSGSCVVLAIGQRRLEVTLPLPGEAPAIDLAAAVAAVEAASGRPLAPGAAARALAHVRLEGRGMTHDFGGVLVVDDTYNANPASMRSSLATLGELAGTDRRRVAVLGEMRELGVFAEDEHRSLGDAIADAGVALAIGCGGLIDLALERAKARGVDVVAAPDTEVATTEAVRRIRPRDAVLVKASRGVRAERVVEALAARK